MNNLQSKCGIKRRKSKQERLFEKGRGLLEQKTDFVYLIQSLRFLKTVIAKTVAKQKLQEIYQESGKMIQLELTSSDNDDE